MKVAIDTNVVISGLISQGPPARVIDLWIANKIVVYVCSEIIEEYLTVLLRPKFIPLGPAHKRYEIISQLIELNNTIMVSPTLQLNIIKEDPNDNIFLECALESGVNILITGDRHLLELSEFKGIKILQPQGFLTYFLQQQ